MEVSGGTTLILSPDGQKEILEYKSKNPHASNTDICKHFSSKWETPISLKMVEHALSTNMRRVQNNPDPVSSPRRSSSRKRSYAEYSEQHEENEPQMRPALQHSSLQTNQNQVNYLSSSSSMMNSSTEIVSYQTEAMGKQGMTVQLLSNLQNLEREHKERVKLKQQMYNNMSQRTYVQNGIQAKMNSLNLDAGRPIKLQKRDLQSDVSGMHGIHINQHQNGQGAVYSKQTATQDQVNIKQQHLTNGPPYKHQQNVPHPPINKHQQDISHPSIIKQQQNNSDKLKFERDQLISSPKNFENIKLYPNPTNCKMQEQPQLPKYRKQLTKLIIDEPKKTQQLEPSKGPIYLHPKKMYLDQNIKSKENIRSTRSSSSSVTGVDQHNNQMVAYTSTQIQESRTRAMISSDTIRMTESRRRSMSSSDSILMTESRPRAMTSSGSIMMKESRPRAMSSSDSFDLMLPKTIQIFENDLNIPDISPLGEDYSTFPSNSLYSSLPPLTPITPTTPTSPDSLQPSSQFNSVSTVTSQPGCDLYEEDLTIPYVYKSQSDSVEFSREPNENVYRRYNNTSGGSLRQPSAISYGSDNQSENYDSSHISPNSHQVDRPYISDSNQQPVFYEMNPDSNQNENQDKRKIKLPSISTFNLPWMRQNHSENSSLQDMSHNRSYITTNSDAFFHKARPHSNPYISSLNVKKSRLEKPPFVITPHYHMDNRGIQIKNESDYDDDVFIDNYLSSANKESSHRYSPQQSASEPIFVHSFLVDTEDVLPESGDFLDNFPYPVNVEHNFASKKGELRDNRQPTDMQPDYYDSYKTYSDSEFVVPSSKAQIIPLDLSIYDSVVNSVSSTEKQLQSRKYQMVHSEYNHLKQESIQTPIPKSVEKFVYKPEQNTNNQKKFTKDDSLYCYTCNKSGTLVRPRQKFLHLYFGPQICHDCKALLLCDTYFSTGFKREGTCRHRRRIPYKFPFQFLTRYLPCEEGKSELVILGSYLQKLIFLCVRQPWMDSFNKCITTMNYLINKESLHEDKTNNKHSKNNSTFINEEKTKRYLTNTERTIHQASASKYKKYLRNNKMLQGNNVDTTQNSNNYKNIDTRTSSVKKDTQLNKSEIKMEIKTQIRTHKTRKTKKRRFHVYETSKMKKKMALKHFDEIASVLQKETNIHKENSNI